MKPIAEIMIGGFVTIIVTERNLLKIILKLFPRFVFAGHGFPAVTFCLLYPSFVHNSYLCATVFQI